MSDLRPPPSANRKPLLGRRALVAESVLRTRNTLREAVGNLGAQEVVVCRRGGEVLHELRTQTYDLVVCGQVFGDNFDSALLLERIREHRLLPQWGTLVTIAAERTSRSVTGLAAYAPDACILKPFSIGQLRERLLVVVNYKLRLEPIMMAVDTGDCERALAGANALGERTNDLKAAALRAICERLIHDRKPERAEDVLEDARKFGEGPWMYLALARIRMQQGKSAVAKELLRRLVEEKPDFLASYDALAGLEAASGEFADALKHLQEANSRSGFSLSRLRKTGEVALRGGDMALAERTLDRVVGKVTESEMAEGSDYVNLVEVLAARGKLQRAEQVAVELRRSLSDEADSLVIGALVAYRRAYKDGDRKACAVQFSELIETLERAGSTVSAEMSIQVLEACKEQGARERGLTIARSIAVSGKVDRLKLKRVRELISY